MNPIENVWADLKNAVKKEMKPTTQEEFVDGILKILDERMTPEKCNRYINHLYKVIPAVIEEEGKASGY